MKHVPRWRVTCYRGLSRRWCVEIHRDNLCVVMVDVPRHGLHQAVLYARWLLWCREPASRRRMSERSIEHGRAHGPLISRRRPKANRFQMFEAWATRRF